MHRFIPYALIVLAISIPGALLAAVLIESDEDQLDGLIKSVENERMEVLLDVAAFERGGLEVSAGSDFYHFDVSQREEALQLLEDATGITSADRVRLCQQQVTVQDERATAVLNVEVGQGTYVALRLNLSMWDGQWRVERIRVMG